MLTAGNRGTINTPTASIGAWACLGWRQADHWNVIWDERIVVKANVR